MELFATFLCQLNFMKIMRLSQKWSKSGHPRLLGILPDIEQRCLSVCLSLRSVQILHTQNSITFIDCHRNIFDLVRMLN